MSQLEPPTIELGTQVWVREAIGAFHVVSHFAHDHGYSRLWRIESVSDTRTFYWLKCHAYPGKWAGEVHALTQWTPRLNLNAPQVLAFRKESPAVLLSEVDGNTADTVVLAPEDEERLWHAAGSYLAQLHTLANPWLGAANPNGTPQGTTHHDPVAFVEDSLLNRLEQGVRQSLFDSAEQAFIAHGASEWTLALQGETARAIHRDYSPRNWMTDAQGDLTAVIDFEHSRWDVRAADLNRWWDGDFLQKPRLAEAFFDGYAGKMPDPKEKAQIEVLRLLNAVGGIVWATRVGDAPFARQNREALGRMMNEHQPMAGV